MCASTYGISTIVGVEAIGQQEFIDTANRWCTKTFGPVLAASGLPKGKLDYAINFLEALKRAGSGT